MIISHPQLKTKVWISWKNLSGIFYGNSPHRGRVTAWFTLSLPFFALEMATSPHVELWFHSDELNINIYTLSIPFVECTRYAIRPLKWLRYIGYVIYRARGYLSTLEGDEDISEYDANIEPWAYCFRSEGKLDSSQFMILAKLMSSGEPHFVNVALMNDRTSRASQPCLGDFRERVLQRDGNCVITDAPAAVCTACHIFPHSKGDEVHS